MQRPLGRHELISQGNKWNRFKQVEALKEETNKYKKLEENTIKQVKKMNKVVQDLKMEIEAIKKTQSEGILEMENLGMRRGNTGVRITNRIQKSQW